MPVAARDPVPVRRLDADDDVDRLALGVGRLGVEQLEVQAHGLQPDRRRLELGRARLRIRRVDREHVRRDLVGEVEVHEREARPQVRVVAGRRLDGAAPRDDPHPRAVGDAVALAVLGREQDRLAADVQRRLVAAGLDARVEGLEPAAGREAQREVVVEHVHRRIVLDRLERRAILDDVVPEPAVDEERARVVLVRARPLDAAELLEPRVAHPRVHRRERAQLVPDVLGRGRAEVVAEAATELVDDLDVVAGLGRRVVRLAHALHAALARGDGPLDLAQRRRRGRTTSASSAVRVRKRSWTTRWSSPSSRRWARCWSASPCAGFSPTT